MRQVGPYELLVRIASANTGYVHSARRSTGAGTPSILAVKLIKPRLAVEVRYQQLLLTEATAARAFSHRNSVRYLDIAHYDGQLVLAMELFRGQTFASVLERAKADRRPLARDLILHVLAYAARVLSVAHGTPWCDGEDRGMLHGEVSPQSILIGYDGTVKLIGIGVGRSRLVLPPARARLPFRAPELFERRRPESSADIYGLGATLYDALGRTKLYARESVNDTIQAILESSHPPLATVTKDIDPELALLIDRMISRAPEQRPASMREIAEILESAAPDSTAAARTLLADEMRILFAEEINENIVEASPRERAPSRSAGPSSSPLALPLEPLQASESLEPSQITGIKASEVYEQLDVDSLVDAIVNSSKPVLPPKSRTPPKELHLPAPPLSAPPIPGVPPQVDRGSSQVDRGSSGHLPPSMMRSQSSSSQSSSSQSSLRPSSSSHGKAAPLGPQKESFSRALEEASSQGDIDALVDAIVHASALAKTPLPAKPPEPVEELAPPLPTTGDVVGQETFGFRMGHVINGRYRIIEKLGAGGMAVVYKVEHTLLEKSMALKLLRPELSTVPYVVQRFQREARFVSQLDDPRIVRVTDFGRAENGSLFLVMELIEGDSLSRRLDSIGSMPLQLGLHIAEQVLLALDHAHRQNVIHRDLKPDNIMLLEKDGRTMVKIVDFGIAKLASDAPAGGKPLTQAGMVFGSPRYMSPEQASGEAVDHRSDLYAVGVMLYEMLSGKRPFDGTSARAILSAVLVQPPPPLEIRLDDRVRAQAIERVIMRAMAKDREERFPSAMAFWESLRATM